MRIALNGVGKIYVDEIKNKFDEEVDEIIETIGDNNDVEFKDGTMELATQGDVITLKRKNSNTYMKLDKFEFYQIVIY